MKKNIKRKCEKEVKEGNEELINLNVFVIEKRKKVKYKVIDKECELGSDKVCGSLVKKLKKDKQKKKKIEFESMLLFRNGVNNQDQCFFIKKKKRKKFVVLEDEMESDEEKICVKSMEDFDLQKKKLKKKIKFKDKNDECVRDLIEMCDEDKQFKKEKKKKKKKFKDKSEKCLEDLIKMYDGIDFSNKQSKKEKKKKFIDKDKDIDDQVIEFENKVTKGRKGKYKMIDYGIENGIIEDSESVYEDSFERFSSKKRKKKKGKDIDDELDRKKLKGCFECGLKIENEKIFSDLDLVYIGQWIIVFFGDEQR